MSTQCSSPWLMIDKNLCMHRESVIFTNVYCHTEALQVIALQLLLWIFFPHSDDKQHLMCPEMKSHGNRKLIKMEVCNNTRIIHHHPSCICLQETDYMDLNWNIILPSFELFMGLCFRRKHYVMQNVCVRARVYFSYIIQRVGSEYGLM